jgi:hypothetical protein
MIGVGGPCRMLFTCASPPANGRPMSVASLKAISTKPTRASGAVRAALVVFR